MESERCVCVTIKGQVQGVGFRAETKKIAQKYGISGKALNLKDGGVEVTACGEEDAISKLVKWLHKGPDGARVDSLTVTEVSVPAPSRFTIG